MTAASCLIAGYYQQGIVKIGSNTLPEQGQIIPIVEVKIHEYFQHLSSMNNDIALLMLQENGIFYESMTKAALVDPNIALRVGTIVDVSGWGGTNLPAIYMNMILWSEMVVISKNDCLKYYRHLITRSNFCVKYPPERRLSDNGGPAVFKDILIGLVSFGATNYNETNIAVLTNNSYFHSPTMRVHTIGQELWATFINHYSINFKMDYSQLFTFNEEVLRTKL